jgi:hypothetical protein
VARRDHGETFGLRDRIGRPRVELVRLHLEQPRQEHDRALPWDGHARLEVRHRGA